MEEAFLTAAFNLQLLAGSCGIMAVLAIATIILRRALATLWR